MRMRSRQKGLGWFGLLFVFATIAVVATLTVKCLPIYLNEMAIARSISKVASDPESGRAEPTQLRKDLERYWDIEDIKYLTPKDVKIKRTQSGRFLSYEYEAREHLFYNVSVVIEFSGEAQLSNISS